MEKRKCRNYWNKKNCLLEALKFHSRSEFKLNSPSAYVSARKNKFLDEICTHMIKLGDKINRCIYSYEFPDNHVYVGLTYDLEKRIAWRRNDENDTVNKHINKTGLTPKLNQLTTYFDEEVASKFEGFFCDDYKKKGWILLNKVKTGSLGGRSLIWNKENCIKIALTFSTKKEFKTKSGGAYNSSCRNGWLNEICSHMKKPQRKIIWTYDNCRIEALKYLTKKEFKKKSSSAYVASQKNKWIDKICTHMYKLPYNVIFWTKEKCEYAASECKTRTEFSKKYNGAYNRARINNWLNELFR